MEDQLIAIAEQYGWEYETGFGTSGNFICPCGYTIEQDGECSECGPSPLRRAGLI